jgi:hypothetical protein
MRPQTLQGSGAEEPLAGSVVARGRLQADTETLTGQRIVAVVCRLPGLRAGRFDEPRALLLPSALAGLQPCAVERPPRPAAEPATPGPGWRRECATSHSTCALPW